MTETFTASNGMTVERDHNNDVVIDTISVFMAEGTALALREFFQHERDEELGRWRWPENSNVVAWASRRSNEKDVTVLEEETGYVGYFTRADVEDVRSSEGLIRRAARAYFEAHPERKPWEDATEGDIWALTFESGGTSAWVRVEEGWVIPGEELRAKLHLGFTITAGRRIWPEDAS